VVSIIFLILVNYLRNLQVQAH